MGNSVADHSDSPTIATLQDVLQNVFTANTALGDGPSASPNPSAVKVINSSLLCLSILLNRLKIFFSAGKKNY